MNLFDFAWETRQDGFRTAQCVIDGVVHLLLIPCNAETEPTRPLMNSTAFFKFAGVQNVDDVLVFACKYGRLGFPERIGYEVGKTIGYRDTRDTGLVRGELISDWLNQTKAMRAAIESWQSKDKLHHYILHINDFLGGQVSPSMYLVKNKPALAFVPHTLLAGLWLQLALAIQGKTEYRKCDNCGKWMEISLGEDGRTRRRKFCSDPCRLQHWRIKQCGE